MCVWNNGIYSVFPGDVFRDFHWLKFASPLQLHVGLTNSSWSCITWPCITHWHLTLGVLLFQALWFLSCLETNDITLHIASLCDGNRSSATGFFIWTQQILPGLVADLTLWNPSPHLCAEITVKLFILSFSRKQILAELPTCFESKPLIHHQGKEWPKMVQEKQAIKKERVRNPTFSVYIIQLLWSTSMKGTEMDCYSDSFH